MGESAATVEPTGTRRQKVGRKCTICTHPEISAINSAIGKFASFRGIATQFGVGRSSVDRHAAACLCVDLQAARDEIQIRGAIDVREEFFQQLELAKGLRIAAQKYLSDPDDPLRLMLVPQAHEIEIIYYDHNDMIEVGFGENAKMMPKKKKAMLSVILESLANEGLQPEMFKINIVDIRKYALDAIASADICIDKFARIDGAYRNNGPGELDPAELAAALVHFLVGKGWDRALAVETARKKYQAAPLQLTS